jgi:hypothetical protein
MGLLISWPFITRNNFGIQLQLYYLLIADLFVAYGVVSISDCIASDVWMAVDNEREGVWKETVMA